MAATFPTASARESLRFNLLGVLPNSLAGLFTKRPSVVAKLTRRNTDRRLVNLLSGMRKKYDSEAVWVSVLGKKSLLLFGVDAIKQVLDNSPDVYADPPPKRQGMSHFQPGAATISRGDEWRDRRRFNVEVLASGQPLHPLADAFLAVVHDEVGRMLSQAGGRLSWDQFAELFEKVTLRVIVGDNARDDHVLVERLDRMMAEANRLFGLKKSEDFDPFYAQVEAYLREGEPGSLVSLFGKAESSDTTQVAHQLPHWMFATKDTLAGNTFRALAATVVHPAVEREVRDELAGGDTGRPAGIDGLAILEGCLQEVMRLWPTTPLLGRETVEETVLAGVVVPKDTQAFIANTFQHRDRAALTDADSFHPDRWFTPRDDYRFNHFSNGPQGCAGMDLALFLGKVVLAELLRARRITLEAPHLDPWEPMPHMLDYFTLRFALAPPPPPPQIA